MATGFSSDDETAGTPPLSEVSDVKRSEKESRVRKRTEKGVLYGISRLKRQQTLSLAALTRKRTELAQLMIDDSNLHLVKSEESTGT